MFCHQCPAKNTFKKLVFSKNSDLNTYMMIIFTLDSFIWPYPHSQAFRDESIRAYQVQYQQSISSAFGSVNTCRESFIQCFLNWSHCQVCQQLFRLTIRINVCFISDWKNRNFYFWVNWICAWYLLLREKHSANLGKITMKYDQSQKISWNKLLDKRFIWRKKCRFIRKNVIVFYSTFQHCSANMQQIDEFCDYGVWYWKHGNDV